MKTRVLYKDGCYIPQMRPTAWPFWYNITDDIFERESEELDCYNYDLNPDDVAEGCARRLVGNQKDFVGEVSYRSWKQRVRQFFMGAPGPCGPMGAMGAPGLDGPPGFSRSALDLQCPNPDCGKFVRDEPVQELVFDLKNGNEFSHTCAACNHGTTWRIVEGLPIPYPMLKDVCDAASGEWKAP
uniref:Uncharacterized protein n=1 Tax=Pseudomonas phage HRDY3 TaxID=3236930 RepID=A0AB39CEK7_9VIRU